MHHQPSIYHLGVPQLTPNNHWFILMIKHCYPLRTISKASHCMAVYHYGDVRCKSRYSEISAVHGYSTDEQSKHSWHFRFCQCYHQEFQKAEMYQADVLFGCTDIVFSWWQLLSNQAQATKETHITRECPAHLGASPDQIDWWLCYQLTRGVLDHDPNYC